MAGGRATLLHQIFQRNGRTPDEIMAKQPGIRAFCFASMMAQLEAELKAEEESRNRI